MKKYQQCTRCVMDTSDSSIAFDEQGVCNHCCHFDEVTRREWFPNEEGSRKWAATADQIRLAGKGQEYDCILGLSGGVDSSYLALRSKTGGCGLWLCMSTRAGIANWPSPILKLL